MVSSEVQRTLVKSPPELWAELSDPAALARHLGELGEIRIVKTKPEERVEWEADGATGTVVIKASGWGTKVTLSVTREMVEPEPAPATAESGEPGDEAKGETEVVVEPPPPPTREPTIAEPECEAHETAPAVEPRRSFFSRLFRRRAQPGAEPIPVAELATEPEPELTAPESAPEEIAEEPTEPSADIATELQAAEEAATEEVTAVLTAVLDRLGAAHHRPFSRA